MKYFVPINVVKFTVHVQSMNLRYYYWIIVELLIIVINYCIIINYCWIYGTIKQVL